MSEQISSRLGTLRQLEIFMRVVESRSMARAAEELHLSQSAVSLQVRKLADSVGLPLHEVVGKQLYLTEAGEAVSAAALDIFESLQHLDERLHNLKGLTAGRLRIADVTTSKYFLPRIMGPFCREFPDIDVELHVGNREQIIERLESNHDDLYIFNDLPDDAAIQSHRFLPNPLAVIASVKNPLAGRTGLTWSDLAGEKFIMRERGSGTLNAIERHLAARKEKLGKTMTIASNEAIKYAVMENMGITIISAYVLADAMGRDLRQLRVEGFPVMSDWHVVYPAHKTLSPVGERFLGFLLQRGADYLPIAKLEQQVQRALALD